MHEKISLTPGFEFYDLGLESHLSWFDLILPWKNLSFEKNGLFDFSHKVAGSNPAWSRFFCTKKSIFVQKVLLQAGFEPATKKIFVGGQGNFLKFFQKHFYSKQGYLREKNIFDTKKIFLVVFEKNGLFDFSHKVAGSNPA